MVIWRKALMGMLYYEIPKSLSVKKNKIIHICVGIYIKQLPFTTHSCCPDRDRFLLTQQFPKYLFPSSPTLMRFGRRLRTPAVNQEVAYCSPQTKSDPLPVFVNEVSLEHSHSPPCVYCSWRLSHYNSRLE